MTKISNVPLLTDNKTNNTDKQMFWSHDYKQRRLNKLHSYAYLFHKLRPCANAGIFSILLHGRPKCKKALKYKLNLTQQAPK